MFLFSILLMNLLVLDYTVRQERDIFIGIKKKEEETKFVFTCRLNHYWNEIGDSLQTLNLTREFAKLPDIKSIYANL